MWYFFRQAKELPASDFQQFGVEACFRDRQLSGLVEKRLDDSSRAVILFAGGKPAGAYALSDNSCKPISLSDFSNLKANADGDIRALLLPNRAMRLVWLSLESQVQNVFTVQMEEAWKNQLQQWQEIKWNGLAEVYCETYHGFALFQNGEAQENDIFFSSSEGFTSEFCNAGEARGLPRKVITFDLSTETQAYRCTVLRQGVVHWSRSLLARYRELVGQKLLRSLEHQVNIVIRPWAWEISLADGTFVDSHFFLHSDYAAQAYRAILMSAGTQMNFVIGSNLTLKLLADTFASLPASEAAMLLSHRLIPAAFSE
ncbi:MAG: hypothetical protein ACOY0R_06065 [Chloroflexota bacterium]